MRASWALEHNRMLLAQGRRVVRLKGGCPSVFSRVSSELRALAAAGIAAELVPGVSSAIAAPLLAGNLPELIAARCRVVKGGVRACGAAAARQTA